ncbi:MAG: twin-arginine translocation signal domain-containing protein [Anaerolineales bacterium]|nr:twin-arginine translocation signal domain-containing protein [Anaerolineales bacterium]
MLPTRNPVLAIRYNTLAASDFSLSRRQFLQAAGVAVGSLALNARI